MGKKSRRTAATAAKPTKAQAQRERETNAILAKLASLGLTGEYPEIASFRETANDYVLDGHSRSGRVVVQGVGRTLVYALTAQAHVTCTATLEAT
jgi:hypothetical protein